MTEDSLLRQAIAAARAGRELGARDLFLEIVEKDPRHELAWMWLIDLLDDLDDRIYACEQVLAINPKNSSARNYHLKLLADKRKRSDEQRLRTEDGLQQVHDRIGAGKRDEALELLRTLALDETAGAEVWRLLAQLTPAADEKIRSLEKLLALIPGDSQALQELQRLRHFQQNPLDLAAMYEEQGNFDQAIATYSQVAAGSLSKQQWNDIYWRIVRLENLRQEKIAHVPPGLSVTRLSGGPALLYLLLMLIEVGINPFAHPEPFLWLGFLLVLLGGFMIALASVRSRHRLWLILFKDFGSGGTPAARILVASAGWVLVLLPHAMLILVAYYRFVNSIVSTFP